MTTQICLGDIVADVVFKDIKNLHLSVLPPAGRVRISAPRHMSLDTIRVFALTKIGWIKQQQRKMQEQERETPREFLDRESHYVWGKRYLLKIEEEDTKPAVELTHGTLVLRVRPGTDERKRESILEAWYRDQLKQVVPAIIAKWEPVLGVKVHHFYVQRMKTRWGSCNPSSATIRLNTELAKKPLECVEYVVVHEMAHLLEPTHNARFMDYMDRVMPNWRFYRMILNRLPVRHEDWTFRC